MGSRGSERTSLVDSLRPKSTGSYPGATSDSPIHSDDSGTFEEEEKGYWTRKWEQVFPGGYWEHLKAIVKMCVPLQFIIFTQLIVQPIALFFGGHQGTLQLIALGLANSIISVTATTFFLGMTSACDTLFAQIAGFKNMKYLGICLQRTIVIFSLATLLVWGLDMNMATLLVTLGQNPIVSLLSGRYITIFLPAIPCLFLINVYRNYGLVQNEILSFFCTGIATVLLSLLFNYILVNVCNMGLDGSAIAQVVAYCGSILGYTLFVIFYKPYRQAWPGWSWRLFENWGEFTNLAVSGVLMLSLEFWAFEISVFLAGLLGPIELGAQSIVYNLDMIFYCIPAGIGVGSAMLIGGALGANKPKDAKCYAYVSLSLVVLCSIVTTTLFATLRYELPKLFSDNKQVIELAAELLPYVAFYNVFINISILMRGVMRGIGRQIVGSAIITFGYYVLALPIGCCLMFLTPMGIKGMWLSFCISLFLDTLLYLYYLIFRADWQNLVEDAQERAARTVIRTEDEKQKYEWMTMKGSNESGLGSDSMEMEANDGTEDKKRQEKEGEKTKLLSEQEKNKSENQTWVDDEKMPTKLILKRLLAIGIVLLIFIGCILCRVFIPFPWPDEIDDEYAALTNRTLHT